MLSLVLLGMLGIGATAFMIDDLMEDDDTKDRPEPDQIEEPTETPQDDEEPADLGATLTFQNGVIDIDVGEDETRDLVALDISYFSDVPYTDEDGTTYEGVFQNRHELHFYLVEDADTFPPTVSEIMDANPDVDFSEAGYIDRTDYLSNLGDPIGMVDLGVVVDDQNTDDVYVDTRPPATMSADASYNAFAFSLSESDNIDPRDTNPNAFREIQFPDSVHAPVDATSEAGDASVGTGLIVSTEDGVRTFAVTTDFDTHAAEYAGYSTSIAGVNIANVTDEDTITIDVSDAPPGNIHMIYNYFEFNGGNNGYTGVIEGSYLLVWTPPELTVIDDVYNPEMRTLVMIQRGVTSYHLDYETYELVEEGQFATPIIEVNRPISSELVVDELLSVA